MRWDPDQYARFADERSRPFVDLLARVGCPAPRRVVDLGCGPGQLTAELAGRWPQAAVEGIDSSAEMIAEAQPLRTDRLSFRVEDIGAWTMPADADVVISNAALQWVPGHRDLLRAWSAALPAGGWLAVQLPGNFDAPSHRQMRAMADSPRWADQLRGVLRMHDAVAEPAEYAALLLDAGLAADVWETTYLHLLPGSDPVLDWVRGTGLRPVLAVLDAADAAEFEADYAARMRAAYPATAHGTVLPYRRVFAVGTRRPG
jgi:trans-aconitate 2-methyltransferase